MYQPNLQHVLAKSALPQTVQDYSAALANASGFLQEIEKAHANPLPGDPLAKSTFSQPGSATTGLNYYDLETGAKFVYFHLAPQVSRIVEAGAPILAAIEQVEPTILPLLEDLSKQVFPQLEPATAKTVIAKAAFAPRSWTPQEQQLWWDRAADAE